MGIRTAVLVCILAGPACWVTGHAQERTTPQQERARQRSEREVELEQARFRGMDANRDGTITRREWRGNARAFTRLDTNRDGVLSGTEVWTPASLAAIGNSPALRADQLTDKNPAYRAGHERGLTDGRQAGKEDKTLRNQWDLEGQRELEQADAGYTQELGVRADYQAGYRAGFRLGYRQGFGPR